MFYWWWWWWLNKPTPSHHWWRTGDVKMWEADTAGDDVKECHVADSLTVGHLQSAQLGTSPGDGSEAAVSQPPASTQHHPLHRQTHGGRVTTQDPRQTPVNHPHRTSSTWESSSSSSIWARSEMRSRRSDHAQWHRADVGWVVYCQIDDSAVALCLH